MAPKKPTKAAPKKAIKPVAKPAAKAAAKPVAKAATAAPKAKLTVWESEPVTAGHHHHDHAHGACCGHDHGHGKSCKNPLSCLCECCPIARILFTRSFWAAAVVAFIVIFATDWFVHTRFLMSEYAASSAFWRVDSEIRHELIFITQALTAMVYAALIIGMGHAGRWWGSFSSGILAAAPVGICAMSSYVMLPFATPYIPTVWAIASLIQGGLVGLAICAALRVSHAPDVADCCASKSTLH